MNLLGFWFKSLFTWTSCLRQSALCRSGSVEKPSAKETRPCGKLCWKVMKKFGHKTIIKLPHSIDSTLKNAQKRLRLFSILINNIYKSKEYIFYWNIQYRFLWIFIKILTFAHPFLFCCWSWHGNPNSMLFLFNFWC